MKMSAPLNGVVLVVDGRPRIRRLRDLGQHGALLESSSTNKDHKIIAILTSQTVSIPVSSQHQMQLLQSDGRWGATTCRAGTVRLGGGEKTVREETTLRRTFGPGTDRVSVQCLATCVFTGLVGRPLPVGDGASILTCPLDYLLR
jgi:hypothetical protein